jgi:hypothetical protein
VFVAGGGEEGRETRERDGSKRRRGTFLAPRLAGPVAFDLVTPFLSLSELCLDKAYTCSPCIRT